MARTKLLPTMTGPNDPLFEANLAPQIVKYLKQTGLGFSADTRDLDDEEEESVDFDIGPMGGRFPLDLEI